MNRLDRLYALVEELRPMVMRGREMAGWLRVDPAGVRTKRQLVAWVKQAVTHASGAA